MTVLADLEIAPDLPDHREFAPRELSPSDLAQSELLGELASSLERTVREQLAHQTRGGGLKPASTAGLILGWDPGALRTLPPSALVSLMTEADRKVSAARTAIDRTLIALTLENKLTGLRSAFIDAGRNPALVSRWGVVEIAKALGLTASHAHRIGRMAKQLRNWQRRSPEVAGFMREQIWAGAELTKVDLLRRLLPSKCGLQKAKEVFTRYGEYSNSELQKTISELIARQRATRSKSSKTTAGKDTETVEEVGEPARAQTDLAGPSPESLRKIKGRAPLSIFQKLQGMLKLFGAMIPWPGAPQTGAPQPQRPTQPLPMQKSGLSDGLNLHSLLERFLLVLHPLITRGRVVNGSPDLLVTTRCTDCQVQHPIDVEVMLDKHLRSRKSLTEGKELPEICRKLVFLRSNGRCEAPGCNRAIDQVHHMDERQFSINHDPRKLLGLCKGHHLKLVHGGKVDVTGEAPDALVWTFANGRVLKSGDYPTPAQLAARARAEGLGDAADEGPPPLNGLPPRGLELHERGPITVVQPLPAPDAEVALNITRSEQDCRLATCEYGIFARELSAPERDDTAMGPNGESHLSVADLCRAEHGLEQWELSERKALAEAAVRYPFSLELFIAVTPGATRRKMLALARSKVRPELDRLAGVLMLHSSEDDFRRVVAALSGETEDLVEWQIPVSPETEKLWRFACREIRRVFGRALQSEEVLGYILSALETGHWGEVDDRPTPEETLRAVISLDRRGTPPIYSNTSLRCDSCEVMWFYDADGTAVYHDALRAAEIEVTAVRAEWLPLEEQRSFIKKIASRVPTMPSGAFFHESCCKRSGTCCGRPRTLRGAQERVWSYSRKALEAALGKPFPDGGPEWITLCAGHLRSLLSWNPEKQGVSARTTSRQQLSGVRIRVVGLSLIETLNAIGALGNGPERAPPGRATA